MILKPWDALGGIMYWGEMDKSLCSSSTNDYLTTIFQLLLN